MPKITVAESLRRALKTQKAQEHCRACEKYMLDRHTICLFLFEKNMLCREIRGVDRELVALNKRCMFASITNFQGDLAKHDESKPKDSVQESSKSDT